MKFRVINKEDVNYNKIGTLDEIYQGGSNYRLIFKTCCSGYYFGYYFKHEIEEVEEVEKLKKNRRVKVIDDDSVLYNDIGIVVQKDRDKWIIKFENSGHHAIKETYLKLLPLRKLTDNDIESGYIKLSDFDIKSIKNTDIYLIITYTDGETVGASKNLIIEVN